MDKLVQTKFVNRISKFKLLPPTRKKSRKTQNMSLKFSILGNGICQLLFGYDKPETGQTVVPFPRFWCPKKLNLPTFFYFD